MRSKTNQTKHDIDAWYNFFAKKTVRHHLGGSLAKRANHVRVKGLAPCGVKGE
jgi:hypothetical protein